MPKATSSPASSKPSAKRGKPATPTTKGSATSTGPGQSSGKKTGRRQRIDWEAVERDYRTDKFTLRELGAKHGTDHATIARKIKADRTADASRWPRDLTAAVREATNAKLMQAMVTAEITKGQQQVTSTVLVAAAVNTQIILAHRTRLASLTNAADQAQGKVLELLVSAADAREVVALSGALEGLARMTKTLIDKEREAHGIDGNESPDDERRSLPLAFIEPAHVED